MSKSDRFPEIHPNMSKPETTNPGPSSQGGAGNTLTAADSKKGGKILSIKVHMLDDQIIAFSVPQKAFGQILLDQVCKYLNLLELDYFGMEYAESAGIKGWLDPAKPLLRQVNHCQSDSIFKFSVKFYTPDPGQLEEEYTRYLFALQIKHDLATSALSCNENTTALLASYILQAEYGDYEGEKCADLSYLDAFKFISLRNEEIQKKVVENHKKHVGQSPAEADLNLLETARRCELYGISMHPAKDHEGVALNLAVAHMGVLVFQNLTKINTFSWAKIRKLSFKRKRFLIKLHPEGYGYYKDTVEFYFESRNECKNFWKKCIEHHGFFRCATVKRLPRPKARVFSKGSSFRYSGRTQKEIMEYVRENYLKRQPFTRTASSRVSGQTSVGTSLAATPLLPLASDTRFSTSASRSSGSQPITSSHENMPCTEMAEVSVHDGSSNSETRTLELGHSREMTPINPKAPSSPVANGMLQEENAEMYQEKGASPTTTTNPLLITNEASKDEPMEQQGSTDLSPSHSIKINNALVPSELIETNANDNDDNISHDSYHLEDHEDMQGKHPPEQTKIINNVIVQNLPSPPPSPVKVLIEEKLAQESISENQEINSITDSNQNKISNKFICNELKIEENIDEISYVLHKRHLSKNKLVPPSDIDPLGRPAVSLTPFKSPTIIPKITVEIEHHKIAQTSPTLYARNRVIHNSPKTPRSAQSFKNSPPKSPKFFPGHQSLDFVSRNKLPPKDSFSSEDHTVNVGSLEVLIEYLQKKRSNSPSGRSQDSDQSQSSPAISLKNGNNQKNLNVAFKNTATQISSEPFLIRHSEIVEDLSDSSSDSHSIPSQHVSLEDLTDMKRLSDGCMYGNRHSFLFQESFDSAGQSSVDGYCLVKDSSREKSPKAENNLEGEEFDDTSSAGNGTVCEETSLHEDIEVLEDLVHSDMVEQSSSDSDHSDSSSESDDSENLASPHTPDKKSVNSAISRETTSPQRHRTYMCVEISNGQIIENKHARLDDDDSFLESHDSRCTDLDVSQFEHDQDSAIGSTSEHSPS